MDVSDGRPADDYIDAWELLDGFPPSFTINLGSRNLVFFAAISCFLYFLGCLNG